MTGLAARLRPAGATGSFDRRLIAPMVLGAILSTFTYLGAIVAAAADAAVFTAGADTAGLHQLAVFILAVAALLLAASLADRSLSQI